MIQTKFCKITNFKDTEWINAWSTNEKHEYYKCKMLNGGNCYKYYKPSVADLILKRGGYLSMKLCVTNQI